MSVYLSLGIKEEQSRNRFYSRIGDLTREAHQILSADSNIEDTVLVMNLGGHGSNVEKRICGAAEWCLKHL